jgi:cell wall-associated NlpC family hydrolase
VHVLRTFSYGGPSIKILPVATLSMNSRVTIVGHKDQFAITHRGHFIFDNHLAPVDQHEKDCVSVAEKFLGVPYFWGGKTSLGLDCSGLVQNVLEAIGHLAPRDTDMQEKALGASLPIPDDLSGLKRGDLIFWKGHVGIMRDKTEMIHASGHQMIVVSEPLRVARDRIIAKGAGPITSIKRIQ